jgi:recombinational DNA repair protein (RecF pathway)
MSESVKTSALLLQSIPYLGQKKILKLLSAEHGLISLFANSTKLSPFCLVEVLYFKTDKQIYSLKDSTLLDPLLHLRENYETLIAAGSIVQDLLRTQLPGKKAPFDLAFAYLKKLSLNPQVLAASFKLKLLLHEGLLSYEPHISFTPTEWEQVSILAFARSFAEIQAQQTAPLKKIESLFEEMMN